MAEAILALGKLCFAVSGVAVGWKLLGEARRESALGVHALALAAIAIGGGGQVAIPIGQKIGSLPVTLFGELAMRVGLVLLCAFVAKTFRPTGALGPALGLTCTAALVFTLAWDVASQPSLISYDYGLTSARANQLAIALPFAWSTIESTILWSRAQRRVALGLAEPALVTRYLLWMVATTCFVAICLLAIAAGQALYAGRPEVAAAAQGARGLLYLVVSGAIVIGIFPQALRFFEQASRARRASPR